MNSQSYRFVETSRTWAYAVIYLAVLGLVFALTVGLLILLYTILPWGPISFIKENLYWILGLAACATATILAWNRIDKTTEKNYWSIYSNNLVDQKAWIVYRQGFHIGNIFESLVAKIKLFKVTDSTPKGEYRSANALNDTLRIQGTLTVRPNSPRFLLLGEDETERKKAALEHAWTVFDSLVEQYTSKLPSDDIIGKNNEVSDFVTGKLANHPILIEHGLEMSCAVREINESVKAEEARARLRASEMMKQTIKNIASDPKTFMVDGKYIDGAITEEEAAAIFLADAGRGSFKRDITETIITAKGDAQILEALKGSGIMFGAANTTEHNKPS